MTSSPDWKVRLDLQHSSQEHKVATKEAEYHFYLSAHHKTALIRSNAKRN